MKKFGILLVVILVLLGGGYLFIQKKNLDQNLSGSTTNEVGQPTDEEASPAAPRKSGPDYTNITISEVIKKDITYGQSKKEVVKSSKIKAKYEMYVYHPARRENKGKLIDRTDGDNTRTLSLGNGELIRGWEQGLLGMKEGGKRELIIPAEMAYGKNGIDNKVPPESIVLVITEVVKIL